MYLFSITTLKTSRDNSTKRSQTFLLHFLSARQSLLFKYLRWNFKNVFARFHRLESETRLKIKLAMEKCCSAGSESLWWPSQWHENFNIDSSNSSNFVKSITVFFFSFHKIFSLCVFNSFYDFIFSTLDLIVHIFHPFSDCSMYMMWSGTNDDEKHNLMFETLALLHVEPLVDDAYLLSANVVDALFAIDLPSRSRLNGWKSVFGQNWMWERNNILQNVKLCAVLGGSFVNLSPVKDVGTEHFSLMMHL